MPLPGKVAEPFVLWRRGISYQWCAVFQVQTALARRRGFRAVLCYLPSISSLRDYSNSRIPRYVAKSKAIDRSFKMDFETFKTGWLKMFEGKTEAPRPQDVFSRWS